MRPVQRLHIRRAVTALRRGHCMSTARPLKELLHSHCTAAALPFARLMRGPCTAAHGHCMSTARPLNELLHGLCTATAQSLCSDPYTDPRSECTMAGCAETAQWVLYWGRTASAANMSTRTSCAGRVEEYLSDDADDPDGADGWPEDLWLPAEQRLRWTAESDDASAEASWRFTPNGWPKVPVVIEQ